TAENMMRELLHESMEDMNASDHIMPLDKLLSSLRQSAATGNFLGSLAAEQNHHNLQLKPQAFDAMRYIQTRRALMNEIGLVFARIVSRFEQSATDEESQKQLSLAQNVQLFLSEPPQRVPVYATEPDADLLQERVIFRHLFQSVEQWVLLVESADNQEKILYGSASLLALIAWAWLNHVVDQSTQVAVDCSLRAVRQIDARHMLEILVAHMDREKIMETSREVFEKPREPQSAMIFIHLNMDETVREQIEALEAGLPKENDGNEQSDPAVQFESLIGYCEQLVVSNWGDVQVQRFFGEKGVLQCLCDWMMCGLSLPKPQALSLQAFGCAAGGDAWMAQRANQIYEEMAEFFFRKKSGLKRFIIKLGQHYYCVQAENNLLHVNVLDNEAALLQLLESPNNEYIETCIERISMPGMPLREIYQRNRPGMVQLYYRVSNRTGDTWVLDEKGSLCHFRQDWYERDSYLTRWMYLLRNVRKRMKNISYQNRELPAVELTQISNNRLGAIEFNKIGAESVNTQHNFIDVQLQIEGSKNGDRMSLVCDGRNYDFKTYAESALAEALQYMSARMTGEGRKPVYVTDVDVPLRLFNVEQRDDIQTLHFMKYVRNFESRVNQLLGFEKK
ncbi:MAG: Adenyl cycl protein, partial [Pseudomonadota bacterium]|nr:Adenyl cycl protein [Pseudomonadota bacterium]